MVTFVKSSLLQQLPGISPDKRVELHLQGVASEHVVVASQFAFRLVGTHENSETVEIKAYEFNFDVDPRNRCSAEMQALLQLFSRFSHPLADISLADHQFDMAPAILVGVDQMYKIVHLNNEVAIADGLVGKLSRFGWVVSGSFVPSGPRVDVLRVRPVCCAATLSKPARDLERLWSLEAIGVSDSSKETYNALDRDAVKQFQEGLRHENQHYIVSLPKRSSIVHLANNLKVALDRLAPKRRSLLRDPDRFLRYDREIMDFVRAGHAEEIQHVDIAVANECDFTHYMPHRQVVTQTEVGEKWRIVFDCSAAAARETSLNSHLLTGPNLNSDMLKLLINFRLRSVALTADISKAYLTISLAAEDRPYFRFLWQGPKDQKSRYFQMRKVIWGPAPSGFLLAAVLREHFKRVDPDSTYDLGGSFYFDDFEAYASKL